MSYQISYFLFIVYLLLIESAKFYNTNPKENKAKCQNKCKTYKINNKNDNYQRMMIYNWPSIKTYKQKKKICMIKYYLLFKDLDPLELSSKMISLLRLISKGLIANNQLKIWLNLLEMMYLIIPKLNSFYRLIISLKLTLSNCYYYKFKIKNYLFG